VFFISRHRSARLSLYGYTTQRDLSGMGSFLIMGLFGVIIASLVNLFLKSTVARIRDLGRGRAGLRRPDRLGHAERSRRCTTCRTTAPSPAAKAVMGALSLYLDFIKPVHDAALRPGRRTALGQQHTLRNTPGCSRGVFFRAVPPRTVPHAADCLYSAAFPDFRCMTSVPFRPARLGDIAAIHAIMVTPSRTARHRSSSKPRRKPR
jgi:hypothetical protein